MQNLSLLTSLSKAHLHVEQFPRSICLTLAVDFEHLKEQKKEEKKKRVIKKGTSNLGWKLKVKGDPHIQKNSIMVRISAGTEKDLWGLKGIQQTVCGRQDKVRTSCMVYTAALRIAA